MPETQKISKITLPNGQVYSLKDENVSLGSTYDSTTRTVVLTVGSLNDADTTEY